MNKEQQITEDQQAENPQWNTQRKNNVSIRHEIISIFCMIPRPHFPHMTRQKHRWMNNMIQVQGKNQPNRCCHLINNPHFRLDASMTTKKRL